MSDSRNQPKTIRFEGELLPDWAQLLDVAARLTPVSEETRNWFARFTNSSGVDDARSIVAEARTLQDAIRAHTAPLMAQLQRTQSDAEAAQIIAAWQYALETIIQESISRKTCSWIVENLEDIGPDQDGAISLRRV